MTDKPSRIEDIDPKLVQAVKEHYGYDEETKQITAPLNEEQSKLKIGIGQKNGFIFIEYNKPVQKLVLSKKQAREMSRRLIQECIK